MDHPDERRRRPRFLLDMPSRLRTSGGRFSSSRLLDLSADGCRLQTIEVVHAGDRVWVQLPDLQGIEACVVWAHDLFVGLAFAAPLHVGVLERLLSREPAHDERYPQDLRDIARRCVALADRCIADEEASALKRLATDCRVEAAVATLATSLAARAA